MVPQKEWKRWKRWSRAYLTVQRARGVDETAFGSMLFTLLDGAALRAFDAISMDDIEQVGGQDIVYQTLDERFPEEATHDRLGEVLDSVFDLRVERGESTAVFTGKARAAFSAAEAEGVKFPDVARGYLLMRFAKLSHERKAVVLAASRQSYAESDIAAAMRTTYPEGLYSGKSVNAVNVAEAEDDPEAEDVADDEQQVLLTDDQVQDIFGDEPVDEQDMIDVLMTWKQTRTSINKEKLARGLGGSNPRDLKKVEARVRCFKCKKVGHFSRNCPTRRSDKPSSSQASAPGSKVSFVFAVGSREQEFREIVDAWKDRPKDFWRTEGKKLIREHVVPRTNLFNPRWSEGNIKTAQLSTRRKTIMIEDCGKRKVVEGNWTKTAEAHLPTCTWTGRSVFYLEDYEPDGLSDEEPVRDLHVKEEDQQCEPIVEPGTDDEDDSDETACHLLHPAGFGVVDTGCGRGIVGEETLARHEGRLKEHGLFIEELSPKPHLFRYGNGSSDTSTRRVQVPVFIKGRELRMRLHVVPGQVPLLVSKRFLKSLGARLDLEGNEMYLGRAGVATELIEKKDGSYQINLLDLQVQPVLTSPEVDVLVAKTEDVDMEDEPMSDAEEDVLLTGTRCVFKGRERKELQATINEVLQARADDRPSLVEVFSPGRFSEMAEGFGLVSRQSFDLSDGWDWRKPIHRRRAEQMIDMIQPDLLIMTPPCGPLSRLQQMTPDDRRIDLPAFQHEVATAVAMVEWCLSLAEKQLAAGHHYLFESSQTCQVWSLPKMKAFRAWWKHPTVDVAGCAVGLRDKASRKLFGKKWKMMSSSMAIIYMLEPLVCTGDHEHQVVEGSSGGQLRSVQSQVYPPKLIKTILGAFAMEESIATWCMPISQQTIQPEVTSGVKGESRRKIMLAIRKLHVNLGHASTADMLRILRHNGAQDAVLELVKTFQCDVCAARQAPKAVKDSAPPRDLAPLRYIGLDVKWLPTWKKDYRIKALNVVCRSSGLQHMYPFRENEQECSQVIARLYRQWTSSYGRPRYVKLDASRCNLGQEFMDCLERDGTTMLDIPGEAHEQMGDVEAQGRHFEDTLIRVIDESSPQNYLEWLECVDCTVEARNSLMKRGGYSPYQIVFGREPEVPGDDLFTESPNPISNGAILEDAIAEFSNRARCSARAATLATLDCRAARVALNSRPRPLREFRPGDEVAVWRRGRGIKRSTARWRGPGVVAGQTGGNYWVSLPGSFVKCSPEQLRLRTTEEREADRFLVRDLRAAAASLYPEVGGSNRHQKNFMDITSESVPPGDLLTPGIEKPQIPREMPANQQAVDTPVPLIPTGDSVGSGTSHQQSHDGYSGPSNSIASLNETEMRQAVETSHRRADQLDAHSMRRQSEEGTAQRGDSKRQRIDGGQQQVGGPLYPPSMPIPPSLANSSGSDRSPSQEAGPQELVSPPSPQTISSQSNSHSLVVIDSAEAAVCLSDNRMDDNADFVLACTDSAVLLAGGRNELNLKSSKWLSSEGRQMLFDGVVKERENVITTKGALRPITMAESMQIRASQADRVVPSKLVLTEKVGEDGNPLVKARWTARGDKDPDLFSLVREGKTQAPTISSNGRFAVMQTIASMQFRLQLGDVTGAFLEADAIDRTAGKLYMSQPHNYHIPDFHADQPLWV